MLAELAECVRADVLVISIGTGVPAAIKIDVEGVEDEVLLGMRSILSDPKCRIVMIEVHFSMFASRGKPDAPREITEILQHAGFKKLIWLDPSHLGALKTPPPGSD